MAPSVRRTGHVEEDAIDEQQFEEQRRTFLSYGYALDPSGNAAGQRRYVGNAQQAAAAGGATVFNDPLPASGERKKRKAMGDAALDPFGYEGPWAGYENEQVHLVNDAPVRPRVVLAVPRAPALIVPFLPFHNHARCRRRRRRRKSPTKSP